MIETGPNRTQTAQSRPHTGAVTFLKVTNWLKKSLWRTGVNIAGAIINQQDALMVGQSIYFLPVTVRLQCVLFPSHAVVNNQF